MPALRYRRGFTLVELLVTLSILAVVIAVALPAVQGARESARMAVCAQRIGTIARGMTAFCSRKDRLTAAQSLIQLTNAGPGYSRRTVSWHTQILPFLDRPDLATALAADVGWHDTSQGSKSNDLMIDSWLCPSAKISTSAYALLHYSANVGTGLSRNDGALVGTDYAPVALPGGVPTPRTQGYPPLSAGPPSMSLADISSGDGLFGTILLAEMTNNPVAWNRTMIDTLYNDNDPARFTPRAYNGWPVPFGFGYDGLSKGQTTKKPFIGISEDTLPTRPINNTNNKEDHRTPSSSHPGGAIVAFCDGSTRLVKESLPVYMYAQMVTSRSVYDGATYGTNSVRAQSWLSAAPATMPYSFSVKDLEE